VKSAGCILSRVLTFALTWHRWDRLQSAFSLEKLHRLKSVPQVEFGKSSGNCGEIRTKMDRRTDFRVPGFPEIRIRADMGKSVRSRTSMFHTKNLPHQRTLSRGPSAASCLGERATFCVWRDDVVVVGSYLVPMLRVGTQRQRAPATGFPSKKLRWRFSLVGDETATSNRQTD
jgi:hypothetical protein